MHIIGGICIQGRGALHPRGFCIQGEGVCIQWGRDLHPWQSACRGLGRPPGLPTGMIFILGGGEVGRPPRYMGYYGIRSTRERYTSYWNAFLFANSSVMVVYEKFFSSSVGIFVKSTAKKIFSVTTIIYGSVRSECSSCTVFNMIDAFLPKKGLGKCLLLWNIQLHFNGILCAIVEINTLLASLVMYCFQLLHRKPLIISYIGQSNELTGR